MAVSQSFTVPSMTGGGEGSAVGAVGQRSCVCLRSPTPCPRQAGQDIAPGGGIPELHGAVRKTRGGKGAAIGAERQARDNSAMSGQGPDFLPGGGIPDCHGAVITGGGKGAAVGAAVRPGGTARLCARSVSGLRSRLRVSQSFTVPSWLDGGEGSAVGAVRQAGEDVTPCPRSVRASSPVAS